MRSPADGSADFEHSGGVTAGQLLVGRRIGVDPARGAGGQRAADLRGRADRQRLVGDLGARRDQAAGPDQRPPTDPLNNPALRTEVNFGIRWDGTVTDAVVTEKSAVPAFDQAAVAAVRGERAKYPTPPAELFGDDGVAHFSWIFARNNDLCGLGAVRVAG